MNDNLKYAHVSNWPEPKDPHLFTSMFSLKAGFLECLGFLVSENRTIDKIEIMNKLADATQSHSSYAFRITSGEDHYGSFITSEYMDRMEAVKRIGRPSISVHDAHRPARNRNREAVTSP